MKYILILALAMSAFAHDKSKDKEQPFIPELTDQEKLEAETWLTDSLAIKLDQINQFGQRIAKSNQKKADLNKFCMGSNPPTELQRREDGWHCVATPSAPVITKQIPEGTRREEEAIHKAEEAKSKESK